jgi:quercetin dioxygenase-like cupin family protein
MMKKARTTGGLHRTHRSVPMKKIDLATTREFNPLGMKSIVLHDSEHFKILNFNLKAGALFPVHSHDLDGQLSILVIEGEGAFLADNEASMPAKTGDMLISDIREPHGVKAVTDMRIVVTIAPPI